MRKKGFTLIELIIVITIIAILVGMAVPYVQNYLEDSRIARANSDLNELRNAIMRYETDRAELFDPGFGKTGTDYQQAMKEFQQKLVGPYIMKAMTDPWGRPYYYSMAASLVISGADDGDLGSNVVSQDVRPGMAPTRAWWYDNNNNSVVDASDTIDIKFSRPIGGYDPVIENNFDVRPARSTTLRVNPFGTGANFEYIDPAGVEKRHPKGNSWMRITVGENASIMVGDKIIASSTIYDTTEASVTGLGDKGIYVDDMVKNEALFPAGTLNYNVYIDKCSDAEINLKPGQ